MDQLNVPSLDFTSEIDVEINLEENVDFVIELTISHDATVSTIKVYNNDVDSEAETIVINDSESDSEDSDVLIIDIDPREVIISIKQFFF